MIVVDASVAVKWFAPEPGSAAAEALLEGDEPRAAPEHLPAEVGQALLRHYRGGGVTLDHCRRSISSIRRYVRLFSTEALVAAAFDIAAAGGCSVYDALYVAAAERWDAVMITADAKLAAKLKGSRWQSRLRLLAAGPSAT
jgi:predicted nucleic acid-binding protein